MSRDNDWMTASDRWSMRITGLVTVGVIVGGMALMLWHAGAF